MKKKAEWRVIYRQRTSRVWRISGLRVLAAITLLTITAGAGYGVFLMHSLAGDLRQLSGKIRQLNKLERAADDVHALSKRLALIDQANKRIANIERYMSYIPKLSNTGDQALAQATATNQKLEITNYRLISTDKCLTGTIDRLGGVTDGLRMVPEELRRARGSIDKMASQFPAMSDMRDLLAKTSTSLEGASVGIANMSNGLGEMQSLLKSMSGQFAVLPEMKSGLDQTNATITGALLSLEPLKQEFPKFGSSLLEMNQLTREMNQTTRQMADSMKKLPKQGTLSIGILTAAQLLAH